MSDKANKRSGMLGTIYNMLPGIDDDYAAKLVYTLENKKTLPQLQQDIADIAAQLSSDSPMTDTTAAKILLDEITVPAALRQLRIYNNATSITELCAALEIPAKDTGKLLEVYSSFSSRKYFDEEFAAALKDVQDSDMKDADKALHAVNILLKNADELLAASLKTARQNKKDIFKTADKYHLSVKTTAELELLYTQPASIAFQPEFERLFKLLLEQNPDKQLCASLAARAMLCQITPKDAQDVALLSKLLNGQILEDDLMIIACRYLKAKTPADIAATFEAVLKKLPHVSSPEENLGLAVRVLLDGTADSFENASQKASIRREREVLRRNLSKKDLYSGYEYDLADRFGGKKTFVQLEREMQELLHALPYCSDEKDNKELACKVLLGSLSQEEAAKQAQYLRDLKAQTLTQGLAPELMKSYLGTKSAEELMKFFEESLAPYTFWKSDREKHVFALRTLVGELNGTYNRRISQFVLEMLENGSSLELMTDMLTNIQKKKTSKEELENLLNRYKQARASSKA
ncbi:hypothetical protein [Candidatus Avelusimicrobium alvi]|uniref:hypothetical protein n=1 Tax=Candidatus Avelusimicrobium alvi TaxID=3416221 RepID=UPI003D113861